MSDPDLQQQNARIHRVELIISNLLRFGVGLSLLIVVIGSVVSFVHHPEYLHQSPVLRQLTTAGAVFPRSISGVLHGVAEGHGQSIVLVGLLLLIATPVARVAVSIIAFAMQKDRVYVVITTLVLALLIVALMLGKTE